MAQFNLSGFELLADEIAFEGEMVSSVHSDANGKLRFLQLLRNTPELSNVILIELEVDG